MICFPDTNALFKLAGFDLLKEAFELLTVAPDQIFILQETRSMCRGSEMRNEYGRQAVTRVETLIRQAGIMPVVIDKTEQEILTYTDGIDAGEAILFVATKNYSDFIVLTDDKNSLRALAADETCLPVFERLRGKVMCLEQLLLRLIAHHGYEYARRKLLLASHCVRALQITLGSNQQAAQLQVESALRDAVERLRRDTNFILLTP